MKEGGRDGGRQAGRLGEGGKEERNDGRMFLLSECFKSRILHFHCLPYTIDEIYKL